ncbi:MAG: inorganic diphosphatase [Candidatus Colwellbacteria bacterium]|nr:inorganic diphosphatase [Candidatus Colwellbacteria bacterium]
MTIDVIVEIPKGSRNKYELDKETGRIKLNRVLHSSVAFPADYGYIENTLSDDGDPLDVLIISRFPVFPGCVVEVKPIALFNMVDTGDNDEKIVGVPAKDPYFKSWTDLKDIPEALKNEIEEFYRTVKALEPGKHVETKGWEGAKEAEAQVKKAIENGKKQ